PRRGADGLGSWPPGVPARPDDAPRAYAGLSLVILRLKGIRLEVEGDSTFGRSGARLAVESSAYARGFAPPSAETAESGITCGPGRKAPAGSTTGPLPGEPRRGGEDRDFALDPDHQHGRFQPCAPW